MNNSNELSVNCCAGKVYVDACGYFVIPKKNNTTYCSIVIIGNKLWKTSESGNRTLIKEASKEDSERCFNILKEHYLSFNPCTEDNIGRNRV